MLLLRVQDAAEVARLQRELDAAALEYRLLLFPKTWGVDGGPPGGQRAAS